ncbi:MAG: L,D-transpeptidase family protein [Pseudomonadota bacterium]
MKTFFNLATLAASVFFVAVGPAPIAMAQNTSQPTISPFTQALAQNARKDRDLAAFYKARGYAPLWTGKSSDDRARRGALLDAFETATSHGLPAARYDANLLRQKINAAKDDQTRAALEIELSQRFLQFARDIQTGLLVPSRVDSEIVRKAPRRDRYSTIDAFSKSSPKGFLKALPPRSPEYQRLIRAKADFERLLAKGGWGPQVRAKKLKPGDQGAAVVQLRDRLIAMGYLKRTPTQIFDETITAGVRQFQAAHGLSADGVAGAGTLKAINQSAGARLQQIIVAMERERWINRPLGRRHVMVNLTDFSAKIIDGQTVTFRTRSVIGANEEDRRSPEFSDVMEFMVINPSWYVPRSIVVNEFLPMMQQDPNAQSQLEITDSTGTVMSRAAIDFAAYDEETFPFAMRQPPSRGNALGLVKFMFPNRYNIYLHDTPAKKLFGRQYRAFSHGCIRLADPFDFAYALLAPQVGNPEAYFQSLLATGDERRVNLKTPVPVHLIYRTAFTEIDGTVRFRGDVYRRDAKIWRALAEQGVALRAVQG